MGINGLPFKLGPGRGGGRADDENESVTSCARIETLRASLSLSLSLSFSLIERRKNRGQTSRRLNWARSNLKGPCAYFPLPLSGSIETGAFDSNSSKYPSPPPPLNLERSIRRGFGINIESRGGKEGGGIDVNTPSTVVTGGKQDALSLTRLPISFTPFEERNRRPLLVYVSLSLFLLSSTVVRVTRLLEIVRYFDLAEFLDYSTLAIRGFSEGSERSVPFRVERRVLRSLLAREARGEATRARPLPFQVSRFGAVNEQRSYSWHAPPEGRTSPSNCPADRRFG